MAHRDLRAFLERLKSLGELHTVQVEVDPDLEVAEITDRQSKAPGGGKGLLFLRVKGSPFPVATNLFGSPARMAAALDVAALSSLTGRMEELLADPALAPLPVRITAPRCQEAVQETPDLSLFPFVKSWPGESGAFITLPLVFTRDPETGAGNCGMYRVRIFDGASAGIRWKKGSGGWRHHEKHRTAGTRMPVAIALGGPPALTFAAALPLPDPFDEISFAGFLNRAPLEMARCLTCDLEVPADAELVIEGYLDPGGTRGEGAFGNHTGCYDPGEEVPVLQVTCVTHRADLIYPATIVGPPPMEDCHLAKGAERAMLALSRRQCPAIVDISLPLEGIFHGCALVAIEKRAPGEGRAVLESLREGGWLKRGKILVVLDALPGDPFADALWRTLNHARFPRDIVVEDGRIGLDATRKLPGEADEVLRPLEKDPAVTALVTKRWKDYGF
ncbi:UbiD family decarboxylase [Geomonas sp. RF6]|uniref:UbiD family decarboxylase n=1 Tax=Geomonas sp. RF6 TaxID=2897342 RepID=UPI001E405778|nr:UbiD family decarboxylase [Geomonas sp. RF6]UFS71874.1 UbiD family decarboxylase [Geomonas sp. RF6]